MPSTQPSTQAKSQRAASRRPSTSSAKGPDAVALLRADHSEVKKLFKEYEKLVKKDAEPEEKQQLAHTICSLLTIHATIEEEIFYPAAREAIDEDDMLDEAEVEHASAKDLIAQIEGMRPEEHLYDAKVTVLGEYIDHHVKEEQDEMFPLVRKAKGLDLKELGSRLQARKTELMAERGMSPQ